MTVAFKFNTAFGEELLVDGRIHGESSGHHLLRRMVRDADDPVVIADHNAECDGFRASKPGALDVNRTPIVCFDPWDALVLYEQLADGRFCFPKLASFLWFNVGETSDVGLRRIQALAFSMFPLFTNGPIATAEAKADVVKLISPAASRSMRIDGCRLGVTVKRRESVRKNIPEKVTVSYPAMWLFERKLPGLWLDVMKTVVAARNVEGVMALHDWELRRGRVDPFLAESWMSVGPLLPRSEYEARLAELDVMLVTSKMESYGLQYLETLLAGVVGVFPDLPWCRAILPDWYPFMYSGKAEAIEMMLYVLDDLPRARQMIQSIEGYVRQEHDPGEFDRRFKAWSESLAER